MTLKGKSKNFTFNRSSIVKNQEQLSNKRDMRKKLIKSQTKQSDLKRPIKKAQNGIQLVGYNPINYINNYDESDLNLETVDQWNPDEVKYPFINSSNKQPEIKIDIKPETKELETKGAAPKFKTSKGLNEFNKHFNEVSKEIPEIEKYRGFLTKIAEQESGFNSSIQNKAGAPAYGYFQFMDFNIPNKDIETFRQDPKLQIKSAYNLINQFKSGFNENDLNLAKQKGYSENALLAGSWLAGNGGVRSFLKGLSNPSDKHWSKTGAGTDVATRMKMFNFKNGGNIKRFQQGGYYYSTEDLNNPVYSKKSPKSIKEQEHIYIKQSQNNGLKYFEKASILGKALLSAHPITEPVMDLIDIAEASKTNNNQEMFFNGTGLAGKVSSNVAERSQRNWLNTGKKILARSRGISPSMFGGILGSMVSFPDIINDGVQAVNDFNNVDKRYNNINKQGYEDINKKPNRFQKGGTVDPYRKNYLGGMNDEQITNYVEDFTNKANKGVERTINSTILGFIPGIGPSLAAGYNAYNAISDYKNLNNSVNKEDISPSNSNPKYDWNNIQKNYQRRKINSDYMNYITDKLYSSGKFNDNQILSILGTIVEESGGDPFASDNGNFNGLLQWSPERFNPKKVSKDPYKAIDYQLDHIFKTIGNLKDKKSWTHGGMGSGYMKAQDAFNRFNQEDSSLEDIQHAFNFGYVRPTGKDDSVLNRTNAAKTISKFKMK